LAVFELKLIGGFLLLAAAARVCFLKYRTVTVNIRPAFEMEHAPRPQR